MERVSIAAARVRSGAVEVQRGEAWVPVPDVVPMSAAQEDSDGVLLVGQHGARYFTNTQLDAAYLLDKLAEVADKIGKIGDITTWAIPSVGTAPNAEAAAIGGEAKAIANELRGYKLR